MWALSYHDSCMHYEKMQSFYYIIAFYNAVVLLCFAQPSMAKKDKQKAKDKGQQNKDKPNKDQPNKDQTSNNNLPQPTGILIPATVPIPIASPSPPSPPPPAPRELTEKEKLQQALSCMQEKNLEVISEGNDLKAASTVWNKLNDTVALAVVQPQSTEDVSAAIACMYNNGIRAVPKSGGHSFEGFSVLSSAVTVDLGKMNNVTFNADSSAVVGGGARLGKLYNDIWQQSGGKYAVVGAECPSIGVGGHILGGGLGNLIRMFGLACDQLLSLKMVNYKGEVLDVSPTSNPDLFWASCGGGGGNFGIVTEYTIKTVSIPPTVTIFAMVVDQKLAEFLEHVQNNVANAADTLISGLEIFVEEDSVIVQGLFLGPKSGLDAALTASQLQGYASKGVLTDETNWLDSVAKFAKALNCTSSKNAKGLSTDTLDTREYANYNSFYVLPSKMLPLEAFQSMLDWKAENKEFGTVLINVLGTKTRVASLATDATAYPYRPALLAVQYGTGWQNPKNTSKNIDATSQLTDILDPYLSNPEPPRMVNFLDIQTPSLLGYYGSNLQRLIQVKTTYDPLNYFQNPLTIPPQAGAEVNIPGAASGNGELSAETDPNASPSSMATYSHPLETVSVLLTLVSILLVY